MEIPQFFLRVCLLKLLVVGHPRTEAPSNYYLLWKILAIRSPVIVYKPHRDGSVSLEFLHTLHHVLKE